MTQNEKDLLLKDLSARLPYEVKLLHIPSNEITKLELVGKYFIDRDTRDSIEYFKPYLFPLSSMTEEQFEELKDFAGLKYEGNTLELVEWDSTCDKTLEFWLEEIPSYCVIKVFDWLNKNHFDYRGLIPMGLAIDATGLNIY